MNEQMKAYVEQIMSAYAVNGREAEERNIKYIEYMHERKAITLSQKESLMKINRNFAKQIYG